MKKAKRFLILIMIISAVSVNPQTKFNFEELEEYIQNAINSFSVPGLAVGIIHKGEIVFLKGFGVRSNESKVAVDTETLFGIASLSKAFTSASIGMLVDEGKLEWTDRVIDHLPWFELHDPYITREVSIADLLSHRVGLATFDGDLLWYSFNFFIWIFNTRSR